MSNHQGHAHNQMNGQRRGQQLPAIVLSGYLGAGKTTLLNYILKEQTDKRLAVIENEIGEVSVDDALVEQRHEDLAEELIVLDNGCVCCTVRGDLVNTLKELGEKVAAGSLRLDGVVIELTGAADPAPVVQSFVMDADVRRAFYVDNVITLVDAKHAIEKLDESEGDRERKGTACAQIAFASTVLLNKIDLVEEEELDNIEKRIKSLNAVVRILRCEQARIEVHRLFNVRAFDLAAVLEEQYMDEEEFNSFYKPQMDNSISNVGVRCEGAINMFAFQNLLDKCLGEEENAKDFLRIKGVLHIKSSDRMFVIQCVHMLRNQSFTQMWKKGVARENRIIFIGRGMQRRRRELVEGFKACIAQPLRFKVGEKVRARCGCGEDDYLNGEVLEHWDELHPYRIEVEDGGQVRAPIDDDSFVKAFSSGGAATEVEVTIDGDQLVEVPGDGAAAEADAPNDDDTGGE